MSIDTLEKNDRCIEVCNGLLRGEISAVEAYDIAIEKFAGEPEVETLERIRDEHIVSCDHLRKNVRLMGGNPEEGSGAWGTLTSAIQTTANLFGDNSALRSLKEGEEIGKSDYNKALEDGEVMDSCKGLIRTELLPRINTHLRTLESCLEKP